jgi:hypothetical protein
MSQKMDKRKKLKPKPLGVPKRPKPKVEGKLELLRPRIEGDEAKVTVHILGTVKIGKKKVKSIDEKRDISVKIEACEHFQIAIAKVEVCFRKPRQLCGKLGITFEHGYYEVWDRCVSIPLR